MSKRASIRWNPPETLSPVELKIVRRLTRTGRLYPFLREVRHLLFDDAFQANLADAYKDAPKGRPPVPPALLMMVTLLQAYTGVSDPEAVHYALFDKRWQMVLDCMGCEEAPFSQGLLAESRFRFIQHDLDRELIRRTVELAKETGGFGWKALRVALDSAPIWGAGRVEDTFNLIGHGLMMCVACAADALEVDSGDVVSTAKLEVVGRSSVKAALDIDWDDPQAKRGAIERLLGDVARFRTWVANQPRMLAGDKPACEALKAAMAQLERLVDQDVEPDPEQEGRHRIIDGTTADRQISVGDAEMRHGRKSKSTTITGFKGHIALELDHELVLDGLAEPATSASTRPPTRCARTSSTLPPSARSTSTGHSCPRAGSPTSIVRAFPCSPSPGTRRTTGCTRSLRSPSTWRRRQSPVQEARPHRSRRSGARTEGAKSPS
jgi:hypothetical protein